MATGEPKKRDRRILDLLDERVRQAIDWQPRCGSILRKCLNHVIVLNERHLRQQLRSYLTYYHEARTHLSQVQQCPNPRTVDLPDKGRNIVLSHVSGLHHEYRRAV